MEDANQNDCTQSNPRYLSAYVYRYVGLATNHCNNFEIFADPTHELGQRTIYSRIFLLQRKSL
jgi:hypothetical protein